METKLKNAKSPQVLRILHGAGEEYEVKLDRGDVTSRPTLEVLQDLVRRHVQDPDLLETLMSDRASLQVFNDAEGAARQRVVAPNEPFSSVFEGIDTEVVEMGVAQMHQGGGECQ